MAGQVVPETPEASAPVVEARGLTKRFGAFEAVKGIDLSIRPGICFGLLGPNGAGKTTAIKMIQGVSPVTEGHLRVLGMDIVEHTRDVKRRLGVVPQEDNLDPDFTVRENLTQYAKYFGVGRTTAARRADELLAFLDLEGKRDARIDTLSGGMKRRLVVARALVADPDLLVLDEPTTGLDPQARHALWDTIRRLRREGKTILLTTHYMDEAEMLCEELVVIDHGKVLEQGRPRELIRKHCGREACEFVADEGLPGVPDTAEGRDVHSASQGRLAAIVEALGDLPHERLPDRIIVYGDELADVQARILEACGVQESILRRATLEDVFLRLTGRALRE